MKNKFLIILTYLIFFISNLSHSEQFEFEVSKIEIIENNIIFASDGKATSKDKNIEIIGKNFEYNKILQTLDVSDGNIFFKTENIIITFEKTKIDEKNLLIIAEGDVRVNDLNNDLVLKTEILNFNRKNNILSSSTETVFEDKFKNYFKTSKFEYKINENSIKAQNIYMQDVEKNNFKIELAHINTYSNELSGKDISINLNNVFFDKNNEPRFKGKSIKYQNGKSEILKGIFTPCKKTDKCPPWQLTAEKITHDQKNQIINYNNVWLKMYDKPVVYFPKFFHPDPTVKRKSGFLMPTFKTSPNGNSYFSLPYYKVLSDNKDFTLTPRLYAKDQLLLQNEFRKVDKSSKTTSDFSFFTEKGETLKSHFFYNHEKDLVDTSNKNTRFNEKMFNLKIQQVSNHTYLKGNKLISPLITNYDLIENTAGISLKSDDLEISSNVTVFEDLTLKSSDRYQYIFPNFDLIKQFQSENRLNGIFTFETNNYIHNYQTNVLEKVNINNLLFDSNRKISKVGYNTNYQILIKNSNTDAQNSKNFKENENYYLSGLFQFNSELPMIKKSKNYQKILKPKFSLKISPENDKNINNQFNKLNVDNIYNLERISSSDTVEGGISLTYGNEFIVSDLKNANEILSFKFANNIRIKENNNLPRNNQLSAKTSNFFGKVSYSPNKILNTKYEFSMKNNLQEISYENIGTELNLNNFVTSFDYLNENNTSEKNSYISNKSTYFIDESKNISFSTRKNKKTNLTEYYNLIYEYRNDCLKASLEYNKDYYNDRDIKPKENIFFKLTFVPFGTASTPNLK